MVRGSKIVLKAYIIKRGGTMLNSKDKAKKINAENLFYKYNGSYYAMSLDGLLDIYKNFNVDKNTEKKWINNIKIELITNLKEDLKENKDIYQYFSNFIKLALSDNDFIYFSDVIDYIKDNIKNVNDFEKLLISEKVIQIAIKYIDFKKMVLLSIDKEDYLANLKDIESSLNLSNILIDNISKYNGDLTESRVKNVKKQIEDFLKQVKDTLQLEQDALNKKIPLEIFSGEDSECQFPVRIIKPNETTYKAILL